MTDPSVLVISLDFELHWGRFDKVNPEKSETHYRKTQKTIPKILSLFEKYKIEATWATVGMLFAKNKSEWKAYAPKLKPSYKNINLSAYEWYNNRNIPTKNLFCPNLVAKILAIDGQELGSHTYAHYYTMEPGQTKEQFQADLIAAKRIAFEKFRTLPKSLVFPRNQCNSSYMAVCKLEGFEVVRTNPSNWFWQNIHEETLSKKIFRTADAFFSVGRRTSYPLSQLRVQEGLPLLLPASRLFRSSYKYFNFLNKIKVNNIKKEMSLAAKKGEIYHLWWHPHNFGNNPKKNLHDLREILDHFDNLQHKYGMLSKNMSTLKDLLEIS